jgi:O-antigen ligase
MSQSSIVASLVIASLIALVTLWRVFALSRHTWTMSSSLIFGACVLPSVATFSASLRGAKYRIYDPIFGNPEWVNADNPQLEVICRGILAVLCVLVILRGRRRLQRLNRGAVACVALAFVAAMASALNGESAYTRQSLLMIAIFVACVVAESGRCIALAVATFGIFLGVISTLTAVLHYNLATVPCGRKCGPMGVLFYGAYNNENQLAIALALCVPFAYLAFQGRHRVILMIYVVGMTAVTGSRTSAAAALVALVVLLVFRPAYQGRERMVGRARGLLGLATVGATATSILIPVLATNPQEFTGRVALWKLAFQLWKPSPMLGRGIHIWTDQVANKSVSSTAAYSAHNQWVDTLMIAGIVGVVLLLAALFFVWRDGVPGSIYVLGSILIPVMVIGTTERPLAFYDQAWTAFMLPAVLLSVPLRPPRRDERAGEAAAPELSEDADPGSRVADPSVAGRP